MTHQRQRPSAAAFLDRGGVQRRTLKILLLRQAHLITDRGRRMAGEFMTGVDHFDNPLVGKTIFSLVTGVSNGVEGRVGQDSRGIERPNTEPCP